MAALEALAAVIAGQAQHLTAYLLSAGSADLAGPLVQKSSASFQEPVAADTQIQADK